MIMRSYAYSQRFWKSIDWGVGKQVVSGYSKNGERCYTVEKLPRKQSRRDCAVGFKYHIKYNYVCMFGMSFARYLFFLLIE
jgi:hypothetical protein